MKGSYWFGPDEVDRRIAYAKEFNLRPEALQRNGDETDRLIRAVYTYYAGRHGFPNAPQYSSGWRPRAVNEATSHAAKLSTHIDANAGDVECGPDGHFGWWCHRNLWILDQHQLFMEHPAATVLRALKQKKIPWCHLQRVAPKSGARCYFPDNASIAEWNAHQSARSVA